MFTWRPEDTDIGDHTLIASHSWVDDNRANDGKSTDVRVISSDAPATLHVGDLDGAGSQTDW